MIERQYTQQQQRDSANVGHHEGQRVIRAVSGHHARWGNSCTRMVTTSGFAFRMTLHTPATDQATISTPNNTGPRQGLHRLAAITDGREAKAEKPS